MIKINKTEVAPHITSGIYRGGFAIKNDYLSTDWFNGEEGEKVWNELSLSIALVVDEIIKKRIKEQLNEEAYKEAYGD